MQTPESTLLQGVIVEETTRFTLVELSRASGTAAGHLAALVAEGVLAPHGADAGSWRFDGSALRRARTAVRLQRELALDTADIAFVLGLLDEIERLRSRLSAHGEG